MHLSSQRYWSQSLQRVCNRRLQERPNSIRGGIASPSPWFRSLLVEARGSGRLSAISQICVGQWLNSQVSRRGFRHDDWQN